MTSGDHLAHRTLGAEGAAQDSPHNARVPQNITSDGSAGQGAGTEHVVRVPGGRQQRGRPQ